MGRPKRKKPYNPAKDPVPSIHDRRTKDLLRNAQVSPIEVDDPMEAGGKLIVMRSTRNDPLAALHARHHIDEAQYHGGRAFQRDFEVAERGPRAIDPSKEAVDGGLMPEPITEAQQRAALNLAAVYRVLGQNGSALVHDVLIHGLTIEKIGIARQTRNEIELKYLGKRFRECLDELAEIYGFATGKRS
jgi:hypothetical protein